MAKRAILDFFGGDREPPGVGPEYPWQVGPPSGMAHLNPVRRPHNEPLAEFQVRRNKPDVGNLPLGSAVCDSYN